MVGTIAIANAKARPFENRTIWNPTFKKSGFQIFPEFKWSDLRSPVYWTSSVFGSFCLVLTAWFELAHPSCWTSAAARRIDSRFKGTSPTSNCLERTNQRCPSFGAENEAKAEAAVVSSSVTRIWKRRKKIKWNSLNCPKPNLCYPSNLRMGLVFRASVWYSNGLHLSSTGTGLIVWEVDVAESIKKI